MPISSDRGGVNTAPIADIASAQITPAVGDFMSAFREGFITVNDLAKRGAALPGEIESSRQNLQDQIQIRPLQRQQAVGQISADLALQPRKQTLQSGQLDAAITALPTPTETEASGAAREKTAQLQNALSSSVPGVREKAIANLSTEQVIDTWTAAHGQPPPETIEAPGGGVEPKSIDLWVTETYGQDVLAGDAQAVLTRPEVVQGYAAYVKEAQNRPMTYFKGDPEYIKTLKNDLLQADLKKGIQAAQLKALPTVLEAQAKSGAEGPARTAKAGGDLRSEIHLNDVLKGFRARQQAVQQIRDLSSKSNPTNQDDLGLIYATVRALDPVSAVREGEISLLQKGIGLPQNLVIQFNRLRGASNAVLTPEIRQGFAGLAETQAQSATASVLPELRKYESLATKQGVPVEDIFTADEITILRTGQPTGAAGGGATATGAGVKPGDIVTLRDGRRIRVKTVTATGIVPDLENPVQ